MSTIQPFSIRQGLDKYLLTAYIILLLSYGTRNILILRSLLILSAMFFILYGILGDLKYQIDTISFNGLFILINIYLSIPLLREVLPVNLSSIEEEIYERDFKQHMSKRQFLHFFSHFKSDQIKANGTEIIKEGNPFSGLIYISKTNSSCKVEISNNGKKLKDLHGGSWIGVIEYFNQQVSGDSEETINWGISATANLNISTKSFRETNSKDESAIYYYRIDLSTLDKLDHDDTYPMFFRSALQAIWLVYTTNYIIDQDKILCDKVKALGNSPTRLRKFQDNLKKNDERDFREKNNPQMTEYLNIKEA